MRAAEPDLDAIGQLVHDVAHRVVLPRFRDLAAGEISEKSPGDLVTAVDVEAEQVITAGLAELTSGIPVVGEEAVAADPSLLELLGRDGLAFVVDPIDGTRAFVEGDPDFAVMVALVDSGVPVASWIALPAYDELLTAARGGGAFVSRGSGTPERILRGGDGASASPTAPDAVVGGAERLGGSGGASGQTGPDAVVGGAERFGGSGGASGQTGPDAVVGGAERLGGSGGASDQSGPDAVGGPLRGGVATAFLPDGLREKIGDRVEALAPDVRGSARLWAGATYRRVLLGEDDFVIYWRTNPWDHAPGAVLIREAGGIVQRWDGTDYRADDALTSLLIAATPEIAATTRATLLTP